MKSLRTIPNAGLAGLAALTAIAAVLATATALILVRSWVIWLMWGWFVVPLGVPAIGVVHALGLSALVGVLTHDGKDSDDADSALAAVITHLLRSGLWALLGWAVHAAM